MWQSERQLPFFPFVAKVLPPVRLARDEQDSAIASSNSKGTPALFIIYLIVTAFLGLLVYLWRRQWTANLALLLCTVSLCFTSLEAYYRYFYCQSDGLGMLMENFARRYYHYDSYGLRASNLPPSATRDNVVVLGDSHVFGAGLKKTSERFSALLAAHYHKLHVINLAQPGWDTRTEAKQFERYLGGTRARIPLVILVYFFNDIEEEATPEDRARDPSPYPAAHEMALDRGLQWASKYSRAIQMFYYRLAYPRLVRDRLGQIQLFYQDPLLRNRHLATVEQFRDRLRDRYGANLLLVLLPYLHTEQLLHKDEFYRSFEMTLKQRDFQYLSMQPTFARYKVKQLQVNRFDPHTNPFANRLIADAVIDYLNHHSEMLRGRTK